jgi:hypothetical protein
MIFSILFLIDLKYFHCNLSSSFFLSTHSLFLITLSFSPWIKSSWLFVQNSDFQKSFIYLWWKNKEYLFAFCLILICLSLFCCFDVSAPDQKTVAERADANTSPCFRHNNVFCPLLFVLQIYPWLKIYKAPGRALYPLQNRICLWWKKSWTHLWLIIIYKTYKYVPLPKIDSITEKQSPLYGFHYWQKVHPLHLDRLRSMK